MTDESTFSSSGTGREPENENAVPLDQPVVTPPSLALYSLATGIVSEGLYALLKTSLPAGRITTVICFITVLAYCGAAGYLAEGVTIRAMARWRSDPSQATAHRHPWA